MVTKRDRAIIFLNGEYGDLTRIKAHIHKRTLLIGCDGGTHYITRLHRVPDVIIGDFDSLPTAAIPPPLKPNGLPMTIKGTTYVRYSTDKDRTDSELAIDYAVRQGCKEIILAGVLGKRLDHILGNIFLLANPKFADLRLKIIEGRQEIYLIRKHALVQGKPGDTISFIPLSGQAKAHSSGGLQYELGDYTLSLYENQGISNCLTSDQADITVSHGPLLVVHERSD